MRVTDERFDSQEDFDKNLLKDMVFETALNWMTCRGKWMSDTGQRGIHGEDVLVAAQVLRAVSDHWLDVYENRDGGLTEYDAETGEEVPRGSEQRVLQR